MFYIVRAQPYFVGNRCNRFLDCTMDILIPNAFYIDIQYVCLYTLRETYVYNLIVLLDLHHPFHSFHLYILGNHWVQDFPFIYSIYFF